MARKFVEVNQSIIVTITAMKITKKVGGGRTLYERVNKRTNDTTWKE